MRCVSDNCCQGDEPCPTPELCEAAVDWEFWIVGFGLAAIIVSALIVSLWGYL